MYTFLSGVPPISWIGSYGVAIVLLTIGVKLVLSPLYQWQLMNSKRSLAEQRKVAPEIAEIRKKYKSDPQKQQQEIMALYREHGVNPFRQVAGCLPSLVQLPILTALYWIFLGAAQQHLYPISHFLFIPDLNEKPSDTHLFGLPIPDLPYLVIPLLVAATQYVTAKMIQQPPNPGASEQEAQAQQMAQTMSTVMPLMIGYFAIVTPAGLGLYWLVSNCIAIIQQYIVNGWGQFRLPFAKAPVRLAPGRTPQKNTGHAAAAATRKPAKGRK